MMRAFSSMRFGQLSLVTLLLGLSTACGNKGGDVDGPQGGTRGEISCASDYDCDDGAFCNGTEFCDAGRCSTGALPNCNDGQECTTDSCSHLENRCVFLPADEDGDGHFAASCLDSLGNPLGDDCDDQDANRFPGNLEVCSLSAPQHDEDCDPKTFGHRDEDLDTETSSACCNEDADGELNCGSDCDDSDYRISASYPEICDDLDNDCDGLVDVNTKEVDWYPDSDGDNFGDAGGEPIRSCAPIPGRSLRESDCNDGTAAVHIAARELCDGADNNCDGTTDEGDVCACAVEGQVQACACSAQRVGSQLCSGGLWNACDCSECVTGQVDCLGELLPRECVAGRWEVKAACRGVTPICLAGECVCPDGGTDCELVDDTVGPVLLASNPALSPLNNVFSIMAVNAPLNFVFHEDIKPSSALGQVILLDINGNTVPGTTVVGGNVVSFTPSMPLAYGVHYTVNLLGQVSDLAGNESASTHSITFLTELEVQPNTSTNESNKVKKLIDFDMADDGSAMLMLTSFSLPGSIAEGSFSYVWDGSAFDQKTQLTTASVNGALGVDDQGAANFVRNGDDALNYEYNGIAWGSASVIPGSVGPPKGTFSQKTSSGKGLVAFLNGANLNAASAPGGGSFGLAWAENTVAVGSFDAAVAENNRGVFTIVSSSSGLFVWSGLLSDTTWPAPSNYHAAGVNTLDLDMDADTAQATLVYSINSGGDDQIMLRDIDASGVVGSAEFVGADDARTEVSPQVAMIASSETLVLFQIFDGGNSAVYAQHRASDGTWDPEVQLSYSFGNVDSISKMQICADDTGRAVAVWASSLATQAANLWSATYSSGVWQAAQLVEHSSTSLGPVQLDCSDSGDFLLVWEQDGINFRSFTP